MIKIKRTECPQCLKGRKRPKAAYRKTEVVTALWDMQHKKCCYCERFLPQNGHSKAVEHFRSQRIFKYRVNDWKNLLLVCPQCNGKKSDKFPVELSKNPDETEVIYLNAPSNAPPALIDPSDESLDPEDYLDFEMDIDSVLCGLVRTKGPKRKGKETIEVIGLDAGYNTRAHGRHIRKLYLWYLNALEARDQDDDPALSAEGLRVAMSASAEFSAVARAFAKAHRLNDTRFNIRIITGWDTA